MSSRGKSTGAQIKTYGGSLYYKPLVTSAEVSEILAEQAQEEGRVLRSGVELYDSEQVIIPFTGPMAKEEVNTMLELARNYVSNNPSLKSPK
jgi:hypothetical protein